MNKIKNIIAILFTVVCILITGFRVHAQQASQIGLQIEVGEYSEEIVKFIQENWETMFSREELQNYYGYQIVVGEPYGIYSVEDGKMISTKFPFYVNGKCVQIVDVYTDKDGNYTWGATISEKHLNEIDELRTRVGTYRFEVRNTNGDLPPIEEIVEINNEENKNYSGTRYSDINTPILSFDVTSEVSIIQPMATNYPDSRTR